MKQSSPKKLTCPCFGTLTLTTDMPLYATTSNEERTCVCGLALTESLLETVA
jgi:hypothetical protein